MSSNILKLARSTTSVYRRPSTGLIQNVCHALAICGVLVTLSAVQIANGQYEQRQGRTYSRNDVERFIRDVERSSQDFQRAFDSWLDRSRIDGRPQEDTYNRQVQNLTSALSTLRSNFNSRNDWWLARNDMLRVLSAANEVNAIMGNRGVRGGLNRQWSALRANLNTLANAFNLPQVGTTFGGIQTYPEYGGNARNCTITGTFRGYTNSGEAELSISSNGTAAARSLVSGAVYGGRCANDVLYFDWGTFNVRRNGRNNIETVEIGNERNRTSYRRVGGYAGDVFPTNPTYPTDQYGNVPSWAVGTFRGMTDNGESELTISPNGVATARSLNSQDFGTGRYDNGVLTFDWGSFRVDQEGGGIRTTEVRNRRNTTSYRRVGGYQGGVVVPTYPTDQYGNVPSWAVGTFRGMTNDGESEITISSNGMATARSLNSNQVFNGQYANGVLTFDWGSFRLNQDGGGIVTVEVRNPGNRTSYRRIN
ncbi:MAG: hypothetical protein ACR2H4_11350 [Pyrinomonadaceae bacterium]